jgi:hypothetical protein
MAKQMLQPLTVPIFAGRTVTSTQMTVDDKQPLLQTEIHYRWQLFL